MSSGRIFAAAVISGAALAATSAGAVTVNVTGGTTSVLLDTALLEAAAGLSLTGLSDAVIVPGALGSGSVAFGINSRSDPDRATTLSYDTDDPVGSVNGTIEHTGSVEFNDSIEVGNFSIFADETIADTGAIVSDTIIPLGALFFAVADGESLIANDAELFIGGDLLVTPSFADALGVDVAGADVGDFQIEASVAVAGDGPAVIPLPASALLLAGGFAALGGLRRYRRAARTD